MAKDVSKLLNRAKEAVRLRNFSNALRYYLMALAANPEDLATREELRDVQKRQVKEAGASKFGASLATIRAGFLGLFGKRDQAIAACETALFKDAANPKAMNMLADLAAKKGYLELAAWQRRALAELLPKDTANLHKLVAVYERLERPHDAIATLEAIQAIDPSADIEQRLTNLHAQQTSNVYSQGVAGGSRSIVQNQDEASKLELESGKLRTDEAREKAIELIKAQDLARNPEDYRIWMRLADFAIDFQDWGRAYPEAKEYLDKAAALNPIDNTVKDRLGDLEIKRLLQETRRLKAEADADPANETARQAHQAHRQRAMAFEVAEFERRVKAQPLKADFHARLGELYFREKRFEEAIGELQAAAKDPKYRVTALTMLGRSFAGIQQLDMAITQFRQAREGLEIAAKTRDPLYYEAQAQESKGDADSLREALAIYTKLYQEDINYRDVRTRMPELQAKLKDMA